LTATGEKIRVAVCDDHELFRRGAIEMLSLAGDVEVVGEAATHEEAVLVVSELVPDVVLLDLEMPGSSMGAYESVACMLALPSSPSVVVFTMHDEPGLVGRFLTLGAAGYVAKSSEMDELIKAIRDAACLGTESPAEKRRRKAKR
jgi:DNA-binding NarL/FixJ family response regulator